MVKRKSGIDSASQAGSADSDGDTDMLDVEFEWFDPQEVDFHGIKQLLKQLFDVDNELLDISGIADLILSQPTLGSTVKVADDERDAKDNDPFAFLSVLNMHTHRNHAAIKSLQAYLCSKADSSAALTSVGSLLQEASPATQVGLILTERFINMPSEIVPPMYKMLVEEIVTAVKEQKPYSFTHYLVLSKGYTEAVSTVPGVDEDEQPARKKKKGRSGGEVFLFHPEDEVWKRHALAQGEFSYSKEADTGSSDAKRAFQEAGIKPLGFMMLIEGSKFEQAVQDVGTYIGGAALPS